MDGAGLEIQPLAPRRTAGANPRRSNNSNNNERSRQRPHPQEGQRPNDDDGRAGRQRGASAAHQSVNGVNSGQREPSRPGAMSGSGGGGGRGRRVRPDDGVDGGGRQRQQQQGGTPRNGARRRDGQDGPAISPPPPGCGGRISPQKFRPMRQGSGGGAGWADSTESETQPSDIEMGGLASAAKSSAAASPRASQSQKQKAVGASASKSARGAGRAMASRPAAKKATKGDALSLKIRVRLTNLATYWPFKVAQLLCVVYILILTFAEAPIGLVDPETGNIIDPNSANHTANGFIYINGDCRPIVAIGPWQKCCLAFSRMSAFSMYPMLVVVFLSKCKACHNVFSKTPLSMFLILNEAHELHAYAGRYIALDVWIHTLFHILRWANQGNVYLLWEHRTGLSGLIVVLATPLITLPMMFWKQRIPYEIRKGLHYLFMLFAVGMCFHVPMSAFPNGGFIAPVMGMCIVFYALDAVYVFLFMTEKIETTTFHVLSSGVQITMPVSKRFQERSEKGGFGYVCLPWVNRFQWHAFSLFEDPNEPSYRQVFMMKTGDWTESVHEALQRNTVRPVWIQGPFPSPYSHAVTYDNQILVASGIGITPALSVIRAHKSSRRINLIWAVRDPAMLEFFLDHMYLDHDGWNLIFYTGKKPLVAAIEDLNTNVRIIKGRPDLKAVIPNIIYGIESGTGLPETYTSDEMARMKEMLIGRMRELENMSNLSSRERIAELTAFVNDHGFSFTELIHGIQEENKKRNPIRAKEGFAGHKEPNQSSTANGGIGASVMLKEIRDFGEHEYGAQQSEDKYRAQHVEDISHYSNDVVSVMSNRRGSFASNADRASGLRKRSSLRGWRDSRRGAWTTLRQSFAPGASDRRMSQAITAIFEPWQKNLEAEIYVRGLDRKHVLPTWGIMYCGGSQPVVEALQEISEEYSVDLNIDSFAW